MALSRWRRWSRVVALVLLAAVVRVPHNASDDQDCSPWLAIQPVNGGAAVAQDDEATPADHCAICHWTRLLRSPLTSLGVMVAPAGTATTLERGPQNTYVAHAHNQLPARAPPPAEPL